ncbi:MAG: TRAP transporter small permease [Lachnospiraceae bacterium]|nr:TRAP transporter small permease [Lachnospiraceae bacterium]
MGEKKKISLKTILLNLDAVITGITLVSCTVLVNCNVLMRYIMRKPIFWCEEVVTGLFVWTVFIGSAYAYRTHSHLGVDVLVNVMPPKMQNFVRIMIQFLECAVLVMLTNISIQYLYNTMGKLTNTLRVPNWYISIAVPLGFGLSLIYSLYFIVTDLIKMKKGGAKS